MHRTEKHSEASQLRLCLEIHQEDSGTDLQMSRKKCNNNQQRRGRRRRIDWGNLLGVRGSISFTILMLTICMAHTSTAVPAVESSSVASSTVVTVAVTPSITASSSSPSSSGGSAGFYGLAASTTESPAPPEQQQPQGQCLLDGMWVAETAAHCEYQTSCRAIQRTGHCCPDYKCDCEKDGKTYANGYKLVDPDTPCTVCYCKGGEIVCSPVTCFHRDDCMPKYVPGRCCPEYDNCPILDNNPPLASEPVSTSTTSTQKPVALAPPAGFNWNITIKEITKPTEIRITDDNKAKPSIPTRKPSSLNPTTEGPATTGVSSLESTTAGSQVSPGAAGSTGAAITTATPAISSTPAAATSPVTAATPTETAATPTISSQDSNQKALPVGNESLKLIASVGYIEKPLSPSSSNIVEQQVKPLVTYTSDGLQSLAGSDPSKVNIKREYTTEGAFQSTKNYEESFPLFIQNGFKDSLVEPTDGELEPDTAGSDNIYHIISTTEGPGSKQKITTDAPPKVVETSTISQPSSNNTTKSGMDITTDGPNSVSSEMPPLSSTHHMEVEDDVPQVESNPAYPSLPEDDFSLRDVNFPLVELDDVAEVEKDEPRSIPSPFELSHRHVKLTPDPNLDSSGSGSGGGDIELYQEKSSTTEGMLAAASSIEERNSLVPLLMYSGEDISGETRIQNGSDLQLEKISRNEGVEEMELGSGEVREPITPKTSPLSTLDIDELGSGSGQVGNVGGVDPKADAESLKLDESQETEAKTSSVDKSSARAEKSFVERALPLGRLYLQKIY
ncbi:probable GPI-anchored adhesin-like protein PGA55 [Drosophila ficusphila]|uniref:probable GPI-anchored adhesin-like protein PGA55 n=1 Tax=Drosophila ficusphila TaxID=30025 RepID=UPI0007E85066|nr:probable GPI-anchored adhesin-like protein PGA55 [Drosophila ficusphila]